MQIERINIANLRILIYALSKDGVTMSEVKRFDNRPKTALEQAIRQLRGKNLLRADRTIKRGGRTVKVYDAVLSSESEQFIRRNIKELFVYIDIFCAQNHGGIFVATLLKLMDIYSVRRTFIGLHCSSTELLRLNSAGILDRVAFGYYSLNKSLQEALENEL